MENELSQHITTSLGTEAGNGVRNTMVGAEDMRVTNQETGGGETKEAGPRSGRGQPEAFWNLVRHDLGSNTVSLSNRRVSLAICESVRHSVDVSDCRGCAHRHWRDDVPCCEFESMRLFG